MHVILWESILETLLKISLVLENLHIVEQEHLTTQATSTRTSTRDFAGDYVGNYSRVFGGNYTRNFIGNYPVISWVTMSEQLLIPDQAQFRHIHYM